LSAGVSLLQSLLSHLFPQLLKLGSSILWVLKVYLIKPRKVQRQGLRPVHVQEARCMKKTTESAAA
jgi:hypothetical protein